MGIKIQIVPCYDQLKHIRNVKYCLENHLDIKMRNLPCYHKLESIAKMRKTSININLLFDIHKIYNII